MEEDDVAAAMERFGGHTAYVHLADGEKRTEPGSLPFDYRPAFRQLRKRGYAGWLTVESGATDSPEPALARARQYLLGQWDEAGLSPARGADNARAGSPGDAGGGRR